MDAKIRGTSKLFAIFLRRRRKNTRSQTWKDVENMTCRINNNVGRYYFRLEVCNGSKIPTLIPFSIIFFVDFPDLPTLALSNGYQKWFFFSSWFVLPFCFWILVALIFSVPFRSLFFFVEHMKILLRLYLHACILCRESCFFVFFFSRCFGSFCVFLRRI